MAWNNRHIVWDNPDNTESGEGMTIARISASATDEAMTAAFMQTVNFVYAKHGAEAAKSVRWADGKEVSDAIEKARQAQIEAGQSIPVQMKLEDELDRKEIS